MYVCVLCSLYLESIVDVEGVISDAPEKITGCTQQDVEIQVSKVQILYCNNKRKYCLTSTMLRKIVAKIYMKYVSVCVCMIYVCMYVCMYACM